MNVAKENEKVQRDIGGNMYKKCEEILNKLQSEGKIKISNYQFPAKEELKLKLKDMLEDEVDDYYYRVCPSMLKALESGKVKDITDKQYSQTLTTKQARWNNAGMIIDKKGLRYLSGIETWRLMGFDDEDYKKAAKVNSNSQLYKQAGNSIVVNVLEAILNNLLLSNTEKEK